MAEYIEGSIFDIASLIQTSYIQDRKRTWSQSLSIRQQYLLNKGLEGLLLYIVVTIDLGSS